MDYSDVLLKSPFDASVPAARLAYESYYFAGGSTLLGCGGSVVRERCVE